jgi:molybdopterin-binding protein
VRRADRSGRDPESVRIGNAYVYARRMPKRAYSATEAARELGISVDTLRRWDREGRIRTKRDSANRRVVALEEIERLRGEAGAQHMSARNRLRGTVTEVRVEGLLAQVELTVTEPARVVAVVTRDAVEELGLKPGMPATAVVKSTSVMVEA